MWVYLASLVVGAAASSGPDLVERAVPIELPVAEVMVFSDRARVTRRGPVKGSGLQVLRLPDLPGSTLPGSVRVTSSSGTVLRVETAPVERERWGIDQVDAWIAQLEEGQDQLAVLDGKQSAVRQELSLLAGLTAAPPLPEKDRAGKVLSPSPEAWREAQDRLARRRATLRTQEQALEVEQRGIAARLQKIQQEVQARNLGAFTDRKMQVLVILDGGGSLDVEYAVPGAFWKPAYELAFDPDKGQVSLAVAGLVTQATGEDWDGVKLRLSTAIPGQDIDLPKLRTWTLADDREYVPTPTARATPRTTRPFSPPTPRPRAAELEKAADRALLTQRTQHLLALASGAIGGEGRRGGVASVGSPPPPPPPPSYSKRTEISFDDASIEGDLVSPDGAYLAADEAEAMPMAPEPMPAMAPAPMAPGRAMDVERTTSTSARRDQGPSTRAQRLAMRSGMTWSRPSLGDPLLPAVSAGGFDWVYDAPLPATVPSNASGLRVPLAVRTAPTSTFYEATPALATTAYLKATLKNGAKLPILAGPANIFVKGTFAGDAQLATTGPGGTVELPLGADEDIRLTRTVIPNTKRQGFVIGEEEVTEYAVKIEVGNYKKSAVTVRLVDVLPKTNVEKIKVELVSTTPSPQTPPDADGLLHWHIDVPAGATKSVTFTYRITRPKGWRLSQ